MHPGPGALLDFWFPTGTDPDALQAAKKRWFQAGPADDRIMHDRFGPDLAKALAGQLADWALEPAGRLALILLLDQVCRNVNRGSAGAFAGDSRALQLCLEGLETGVHRALTPIQRVFFYMPLQHSESVPHQQRAVELYQELAEESPVELAPILSDCANYARLHHDIVVRFGRFPHRNRLLERDSTAEEQEYLDAGAPSFGQ